MTPLPNCLIDFLRSDKKNLAWFFIQLWANMATFPGAEYTPEDLAEDIGKCIESPNAPRTIFLRVVAEEGIDAMLTIHFKRWDHIVVKLSYSTSNYSPTLALEAARLHVTMANIAMTLEKAFNGILGAFRNSTG